MKRVDTGLFLGGPADGRRLIVDPDLTVVVVEVDRKRHFYNSTFISGEECIFEVWLHSDTRIDAALERLLNVYPEERQK